MDAHNGAVDANPSGERPRYRVVTRRRPRNNLLIPPTPFVGRRQEVVAALAILADEGARLLTVIGPGGVGKTRLAIRIAEEIAESGDDVVFVSLAAIRDPDLVIPAIAGALGVQADGNRPLAKAVADEMAAERCLLVLDNLEQVLPAGVAVVGLLGDCPRLRVLATSRAPLNVHAEREFPLSPLPLPPVGTEPTAAALIENEAVALFVERASALDARFDLTEDTARAIAAICARVDGLPLAIELVAARAKALAPVALLRRLERRLPLLGGGARDAPGRQQTMHDAISWSYELLEPEEQFLFRRLAIFEGGFDLEAADAVAGADRSELDQQASLDVLNLVGALVDKSLVRPVDGTSDIPRCVMLETIREYGRERIEGSGEVGMLQHRHAAYFLGLAERAAPSIPGPDQGPWLARLDADIDNLRAAIDWSCENDPESAQRFAGALSFFWFLRGHLREGADRIVRALAAGRTPAGVRARALLGAGLLLHRVGDDERAIAFLDEGRARFTEAGDVPGLARLLVTRGIVAEELGEFAAAATILDEALALLATIQDPVAMGAALAHRAIVAYGLGKRGTRTPSSRMPSACGGALAISGG